MFVKWVIGRYAFTVKNIQNMIFAVASHLKRIVCHNMCFTYRIAKSAGVLYRYSIAFGCSVIWNRYNTRFSGAIASGVLCALCRVS